MNVPHVDAHGRLEISTVNSLGADVIKAWIRNRLYFEDPYVPIDLRASEPPYQLFLKLAESSEINLTTKHCIWKSAAELVESIDLQKQATENDSGTIELLLFVGSLAKFGKDEEIESLQSYLFELIDTITDPIHRKEIFITSIQALVELKTFYQHDYWISLYNPKIPEMTSTVFEALCQFHPDRAFEWLGSLQPSEEVYDAFANLLPMLIEKFDRRPIERYFQMYLLNVTTSAMKAELLDIWRNEGFDSPEQSVAELAELGATSPANTTGYAFADLPVTEKIQAAITELEYCPIEKRESLANQIAKSFSASEKSTSAESIKPNIPNLSELKYSSWLQFPINDSSTHIHILGDPAFWLEYEKVFLVKSGSLRISTRRLLNNNLQNALGPFLQELAIAIEKAGRSKKDGRRFKMSL